MQKKIKTLKDIKILHFLQFLIYKIIWRIPNCQITILWVSFEACACWIIMIEWNLPMFTMRIPSSWRNLRATATFSNFWDRKVGRLLCFGRCFCDRTSIKLTSLRPSERSHSRSPMCLLTHLRCSLAHLVKVFCCIRFHSASSANSRSTMSSSSVAELSHVTDFPFSFILSAGLEESLEAMGWGIPSTIDSSMAQTHEQPGEPAAQHAADMISNFKLGRQCSEISWRIFSTPICMLAQSIAESSSPSGNLILY